jgi:hypothetical protein
MIWRGILKGESEDRPPARRWKRIDKPKYKQICRAVVIDCFQLMRLYNGEVGIAKLRSYAHRSCASHYIRMGLVPHAEQINEICDDLARHVKRTFRAGHGRPPPKSTRADKQARNAAILQSYFSQTPPPSRRDLANEFGVSAMTIQRALEGLGADQSRRVALDRLENAEASLIARIYAAFPISCKRLVSACDVFRYAWPDATEFEFDKLESVIESINGRRLNVQFVITDLPERSEAAPWIVITRGRKTDASKLKKWARDRESERQERQGRRSFCQRHYLLPSHPIPLIDPVLRDLSSVLHVMLETFDLLQWRNFLLATAGPDAHASFAIKDHGAVLNVLNGLFRLRHHNNVDLFKVTSWLPEKADQGPLNNLLALIAELSEMATAEEALKRWIDVTEYSDRIKFGTLPGRDHDELKLRLCAVEPEALPWEALQHFAEADITTSSAEEDFIDMFMEAQKTGEDWDRMQGGLHAASSHIDVFWHDDDASVDQSSEDQHGYIMPPDEADDFEGDEI